MISENWVYAGQTCCRSLQLRVWCGLQVAMTRFVATERTEYRGLDGDPRPCLFDCAGRGFTDCPMHPSCSHKDGTALDFGYFTRGTTNNTQSYRPFTDSLRDSYPLTSMELFDPQRTIRFLEAVRAVFPAMRWRVRKNVYLLMEPFMSREIDMASNPDDNPNYNHDRHMHVELLGFDRSGMITV